MKKKRSMYTVLGHCPLGGCELLPALICPRSNWHFLVSEGVRRLVLCAHDLQQCAFGASRDLSFVWCFSSLSWPSGSCSPSAYVMFFHLSWYMLWKRLFWVIWLTNRLFWVMKRVFWIINNSSGWSFPRSPCCPNFLHVFQSGSQDSRILESKYHKGCAHDREQCIFGTRQCASKEKWGRVKHYNNSAHCVQFTPNNRLE